MSLGLYTARSCDMKASIHFEYECNCRLDEGMPQQIEVCMRTINRCCMVGVAFVIYGVYAELLGLGDALSVSRSHLTQLMRPLVGRNRSLAGDIPAGADEYTRHPPHCVQLLSNYYLTPRLPLSFLRLPPHSHNGSFPIQKVPPLLIRQHNRLQVPRQPRAPSIRPLRITIHRHNGCGLFLSHSSYCYQI